MAKSRPGSANARTFLTATAIAIVDGGADYEEDDRVAIAVPGARFRPVVNVDTVDVDGVILTASLVSGGELPNGTSGTQTSEFITGAGTGATFTLTTAPRGT